jgi:hypothetical protein
MIFFNISIWMKSALQIFGLGCTWSGCVLFLCGACRVPLDLENFLRLKFLWHFFDISRCCCKEWALPMVLLCLTPVLSHSVLWDRTGVRHNNTYICQKSATEISNGENSQGLMVHGTLHTRTARTLTTYNPIWIFGELISFILKYWRKSFLSQQQIITIIIYVLSPRF